MNTRHCDGNALYGAALEIGRKDHSPAAMFMEHKLYQMSADAGYVKAMLMVAYLYKNGLFCATGIDGQTPLRVMDAKKAYEYIQWAARLGNTAAKLVEIKCRLQGIGTNKRIAFVNEALSSIATEMEDKNIAAILSYSIIYFNNQPYNDITVVINEGCL